MVTRFGIENLRDVDGNLEELRRDPLKLIDHVQMWQAVAQSSMGEFDFEFRKDYLEWHIHYHMGSDEKRGIAKFMQLLEQTLSLKVHAPHFVS